MNQEQKEWYDKGRENPAPFRVVQLLLIGAAIGLLYISLMDLIFNNEI